MQLKEYIKLTGKSLAEVGKELGGYSAAAVSRWQNGKAVPDPEPMRKIMEWSKGNVTANDFYVGGGKGAA